MLTLTEIKDKLEDLPLVIKKLLPIVCIEHEKCFKNVKNKLFRIEAENVIILILIGVILLRLV